MAMRSSLLSSILRAQSGMYRPLLMSKDTVSKPLIPSHPSEFACSLTPRSEKAVLLIESVLEEHPFESGDADKLREVKR